MLNQVQLHFMKALKAAVWGRSYLISDMNATELNQFFQLASIQHVLPLICEAVYMSEDFQNKRLFLQYKKRATEEVISQTVRTAQFFDLYRYLADRGLHPIVLKGAVVRMLYKRGNFRMSVDEDLLIDPSDMHGYHEALLSYGMQKMKNEDDIDTETEISYIEPDTNLYIEVHKSLFDPRSQAYGDFNAYFRNDSFISMECGDCHIHVLEPTDHFFYLVCHALKHFMHSGFGIRQICDIVVFLNSYVADIQWDRIWMQCREIQAEGFLKAVLRIGEKYFMPDLGCSACMEEWNIADIDEEPLLEDVLDGGIYGASEMFRLHSSNITLGTVESQKAGKRSQGTVFHSIFLPLKSMRGRYKYLETMPFLLPAAWFQRIVSYLREILKEKNGRKHAVSSIQLGNKRVDLMKYYGILK